jgi:hypothetical protein
MTCMIKVSEFIRRVYGTKADGATPPTPQTVRNQCARGDIPAEQRGKLWYIDFDAYQNKTGDDLVDSVLGSK